MSTGGQISGGQGSSIGMVGTPAVPAQPQGDGSGMVGAPAQAVQGGGANKGAATAQGGAFGQIGAQSTPMQMNAPSAAYNNMPGMPTQNPNMPGMPTQNPNMPGMSNPATQYQAPGPQAQPSAPSRGFSWF